MTYFHRAQESLIRLPFLITRAKLMDNFFEKGFITNIYFFSKIIVADDIHRVQNK